MLASALLVATGCSRQEFEDRTAVVELDGRADHFEVASCGLDDTTAFVVGRADDGTVLQAVVGVEGPEDLDGVPASTAITVGSADRELAASGAEAWERRGGSGRPPGTITSARIRGSRIQVGGELESVATDGSSAPPATPGETIRFSLDARCDEVDG